MKKVFAILAVVAFVACNSGENKDVTKDTPAVAPAPTETPSGDSTNKSTGDSTAKSTGDSTAKGNK